MPEAADQRLKDRIMEAVIALADADSDNEAAYHAAWERLRLAVTPWICPEHEEALKLGVQRSAAAIWALMGKPMGTKELAKQLHIHQRTAQDVMSTLRAAAVPLQGFRKRGDRLKSSWRPSAPFRRPPRSG